MKGEKTPSSEQGVEIVAEVLDLLQLGTHLSCELPGSQDEEGNPHRTQGSPCEL